MNRPRNTGHATSLTKGGTGSLTLSGGNTYSGPTNITGGTIQVTNVQGLKNSIGLSVGNTGTFNFASGTGGNLVLAPTSGTALTLTNGSSIAVMAVLDNLNKGAAGGAVQWMNRLLGLDETAGLTAPAPGWT